MMDMMKPANGKKKLHVPRQPPSRLPREQFLCLVRIIADFGFGDGVLRLLRRELRERRAQCSRGAPRGWEERRGLPSSSRRAREPRRRRAIASARCKTLSTAAV